MGLQPERLSPEQASLERGHKIGLRLKILSNQIGRAVESALAAQGGGVTPFQSHILAFVDCGREKGPVFQRDIERRFDIRRSTATGILQLMEKNGLIRRLPVEEDGRLKRLVLTDKAALLRRAVQQRLDLVEERLSACLTPEESAALFDILDKLSRTAADCEAAAAGPPPE